MYRQTIRSGMQKMLQLTSPNFWEVEHWKLAFNSRQNTRYSWKHRQCVNVSTRETIFELEISGPLASVGIVMTKGVAKMPTDNQLIAQTSEFIFIHFESFTVLACYWQSRRRRTNTELQLHIESSRLKKTQEDCTDFMLVFVKGFSAVT